MKEIQDTCKPASLQPSLQPSRQPDEEFCPRGGGSELRGGAGGGDQGFTVIEPARTRGTTGTTGAEWAREGTWDRSPGRGVMDDSLEGPGAWLFRFTPPPLRVRVAGVVEVLGFRPAVITFK
jgi:hypothetical protein